MSSHPVATQSPSVEEPVNLPEPQGLTPERLRAWAWHRQGLDGSLAGCTAEQVLARAGWARSVGGANPYLTLFARAGIRREQVDADVLAHRILELPVARGCTYVLGRDDFAWALKLGKDAAEAIRVLGRLGVERGEITLLEEQVLHVLAEAEGPMDPRQLKEELGDSVRNLGEEGKKKGATTTLPTALGILQAQGKIRRVPANGRLDQQRYAYEPWGLAPSGLDDDAARTELVRRYLGWTGGATFKQSQWFTGFTVAQSKAALAAVGAIEVSTALPEAGGDPLWMLPADVGRLAAFEEPAGEQIQLLAGTDSLFLLRRNAADLLEEEDQHRPALGSLALQADLPDHPILDRGRIIGLWQYDPAKGRIVPWLFHGPTPAITQRIAEVEAWIREDLGDFRAFSLDSPASRQKRIDALAASAVAAASSAAASSADGEASRNGSGAVPGEEIPQQRGALLLPDAGNDFHPVVEPALAEDVEHGTRGAGLLVPGTEHHPRNPCEDDRTRAHCARFQSHHQRAVLQPPAVVALAFLGTVRPQPRGGLPDGDHLGMGRRVPQGLAFVSPGAQHGTVGPDHDGADRHVRGGQRIPGLRQGKAHPLGMAGLRGSHGSMIVSILSMLFSSAVQPQ